MLGERGAYTRRRARGRGTGGEIGIVRVLQGHDDEEEFEGHLGHADRLSSALTGRILSRSVWRSTRRSDLLLFHRNQAE